MRAQGAIDYITVAVLGTVAGLAALVLRSRRHEDPPPASAAELDALRRRVDELEVQLEAERTIRRSSERKSFADRTGSNPRMG